ncbi:hypothetical protein [Nitrosophilus alvini]|uniref:5'-methylthioadenosine/S-adenosylhomocysteine nucleosidase family protein n=1 Tax=Nitrosophilus alvini TaxID=2714855 RepID=UPI00190B2371|nr:hypothetical protein [Nitrosophilus alvini]
MIYIVTALYAEAVPVIEKFSLKPVQKKPFALFATENIALVVSGIGKISAAAAVAHILTIYPSEKGKIFNIGIAAGRESFDIGEIVCIEKSVDSCSNKVFHLKPTPKIKKASCITVSTEMKKTIKYDLADMEASAIVEVAKKFRIQPVLLKVISDHFEPEKIKKESVSDLILKNMNIIEKLLKEYL